MIDNTINITASSLSGLDKSGGFVKASVARGPDSTGAFTLRLDGGREVSGVVEGEAAKLWMTPGQNVFINLSDGRIIVPGTAQEQSQQPPLSELPPQSAGQPPAGQTPQPGQTPVQPFAGMKADVFVAGERAKQLRDGLESPLLRSLPAELIEKIANERGGIDMAALNALDALLRNRSLPVDASSPVQLERLEQWLRLALDNPKLAEDLAGRVPVAGAREIMDKFLRLQKLGANFLPDNLIRQLSAERFFLAGGAGNALNGASANNGAGQNAGFNAENGAFGNTESGELLKELFAKAFSAAPAALLDLVKRIDSSDINANNVKLPPEEARRILGELVNRLPSQPAVKPELVHDLRPLPPRVTEAVNTPVILNKTELPNTNITPNKADLSNTNIISSRTELPNKHIIPDRGESPNTNIIPNRSESSNVNIISSKSESHNINIIQNKPESPVMPNRTELSGINIIPNKTDSTVATVVPNKPDSPNAYIIPNRVDSSNTPITPNKPDSPNAYIIPNQTDSSNTSIISNKSDLSNTSTIPNKPDSPNAYIIPNRADSSNTSIIPNKSDLQNASIMPNRTDSPAGLSNGGRHPVLREIYERIESAPRFNVPAESKNAVFSQIDAAREIVRSVIDGGARAAGETIVKSAISGNINIGNTDNKPAFHLTQLATNAAPPPSSPQLSSIPPRAQQGEAIVNTAISGNMNTGNTDNKPEYQLTQQATNPAPQLSSIPPRAQQGEAIVNTAISGNMNTGSMDNKPVFQFTQQATNPAPPPSSPQLSSIPPRAQQGEAIVNTAISGNMNTGNTDNKPEYQLTQQAAGGAIDTGNKHAQSAPGELTPAARRLLDNTEKLRGGFQSAFASLELQSRVFPSDFSGGADSAAVRQSLDALRLETLLNASKALQNIFSIVDELRGTAEFFSGKSREPDGAEKLLARTAENLARQARTCGNEIADRLSDMLRELNRMQPDGSKGDGAAAARQSPAEIMRSAALTAAGGLESLHLLASTARGQELQQQVVALPVKIGEEWTELQVKIIKERKGKGKKEKKEGGGHVSVYLNVAPSMLGEVAAHLDYYPPASLKLSFQFVKPEAEEWFREQAAPLREALSAAGLPGAALEFHTRPRPIRAQSVENQEVAPAGANMAGDPGRVDFRV